MLLDSEIWVQSPTYKKYEVSNFGNVRHIGSKPRKLQINRRNGYVYVLIRHNGKPKNVRVHRIVAEAFIPPIAGKKFINHKDGDRTNNRIDNLEWCTASENELHKARVLKHKQTPPVNFKRVTDTDTGITYESIKEAAEATGADSRRIGEVASGKRKSTNGRHFVYARY